MADDKSPAKESPESGKGAEPPKKGGLPIKTLAIVLVVMVLEGVGVMVVVKMSGGGAAKASAHELEGADHADREALVEIPLLAEKFQNMQSGRVWIWDADIQLKLKRRNEEFVRTQLEARKAEILEGVALIFRKAQHNQLREPGLETVGRQLTAYLNDVLGYDSEGLPRFERVLVPKCSGFPADF